MDEDACELLNTAGLVNVRHRQGLSLRVHVVQLQHRYEVCRGVLLNRAGDEL